MKLGRGLTIVVVLLFLPLLSRILASVIGWIGGCRAAAEPTATCLIGGTDWAGVLGWLAAVGWLALVTLPLAGILILAVLLRKRTA